MRYFSLGSTALEVSEISLGCGRINTLNIPAATELLGCALDAGINLFDHADAYGGRSEEVFAEAIGSRPSMRDMIILQSKCAICSLDTPDNYYDRSREHILASVPGILRRLKTDCLDILTLHRPYALIEPEEVAKAFGILHREGKVRYFGVSNFNRFHLELLEKYVGQNSVVNQVQFSPAHTPMIDAGLNVNMTNGEAVLCDGGTIECCRPHGISP